MQPCLGDYVHWLLCKMNCYERENSRNLLLLPTCRPVQVQNHYRLTNLKWKDSIILRGGPSFICLQAINAIGQSECSREASYTTAASVPAAPLPPTLLCASPTSMSVEWQVPYSSSSI